MQEGDSGEATDDHQVVEPRPRSQEDPDVVGEPGDRRDRREGQDEVEDEEGRELQDQASNDGADDPP